MKEFTWANFLQATRNEPHWDLLEKTVALIGHPGRALDLGSGAGRDTRYLLSQGWSVTAVDSNSDAIAILAELPQDHLQVVQSSFEDFAYGHEVYDLINAQFALPFNPKASFNEVFTCIKQAIKPEGFFAGQFFGVRDEWNTPNAPMTFLTREEAKDLLSDMKVVEFDEVDKMGHTALGTPKRWHVFHVIAQKGTV